MKKSYLFLFMIISLTSCDIDDNGNVSVSPWFWVVLIIAIIVFIISIASVSQQQNKTISKMKDKGISFGDFHRLGNYIGGLDNKNEVIKEVYAKKEGDKIAFYKIPFQNISMPESINSSINISDIDDVKVEDKTSVEKRLTVGRLLLVGVFAFAWKKKKIDESAYLIIEWKKGKFSNTTIFNLDEKDAFLKANKARNELIEMCTKSD